MKREHITRKVVFVLVPFVAAILFFVYFLQAGQTNDSGCIKCHTSEQTLKTLHRPVKIDTSEGEG
jgi:nitrate/TMAO reductase-like tetraheme cytochrome c subunit